MRRRPDELVVGIRLRRRRYSYQVFEKVGGRRAQAIAKVGLAITRSGAGWRVVAASVAPTIRRCPAVERLLETGTPIDRKSTRLNSSHTVISYAVFCLKKKNLDTNIPSYL